MNFNLLMNRTEAAQYLGIKPQTLAVWATTKRYDLPYVKVGRLVKYSQNALDTFIQQQTVVMEGGACVRH